MNDGQETVHCVAPDCGDRVVHHHDGGDYGLEDIPELFQLGSADPSAGSAERLRITADQIRELKVLADAYSFDFEPGLISLCLDLHRFALGRSEAEFTFEQRR